MKRKFVDSEGVLFKASGRKPGGESLSSETLSSETLSSETLSGEALNSAALSGETLSGEALNSAALSGETLSGEALNSAALSGEVQPLKAQRPEALSSKSTGSEPPGSATEAPGHDTEALSSKTTSSEAAGPAAGAPSPAAEALSPAAEAVLRSFIRMIDLKGLYRQGWLKRGVPEERAESVADHSFGTALLAVLLADTLRTDPDFAGLDRQRCIEMALVHELGEVYVGDLTPVDGVSREDKYRQEREAFIKVVEGLPNGKELLTLWEDFETGASPEARFIRQLDRLEMGIQAALLKAEGYQRMDEFLKSAHKTVTHKNLKAILSLAEAYSNACADASAHTSADA